MWSPLDYISDREHLFGQIHTFLTFHFMAKKLMRCAAISAEKAAVRESSQPRAAGDVLSATSSTLPAATVAADARSESPHATDDGSQVKLI